VAAYVRWVGREVLLFLVAIIYSATLLARALELAPVLMFISTGLAAASLTRQTDLLLDHIRRLSLPVYVVFFTLAGARLHLEHLVHVAPFALALFGVRAWGMRAGLQLAARAGALDPATERHGWLGYISQAGVALSLAAVVGQRFGEAGQALETLIVSVIALNELVGPVLLKLGLTLAGEARAERRTGRRGHVVREHRGDGGSRLAGRGATRPRRGGRRP
jgi:Kef-type K+ transport system membrane component KefB